MTDTSLAPAATPTKADAKLDLDGLPKLLGFHLRLANVALYRHFTASLTGLDLTQKQCAILQLIGANPGVSQVDLASTLGADRATMMAMVDRLEQRGLLLRKRSTADRRRQELNLTPQGVTTLAEARAVIDEHEKHFTAMFTPAELAALIDALSRVHGQV